MRILLISPPITHGDELQAKVRGCMPPLDLMYLASYLLHNGHDAWILDLYANELAEKDLIRYVATYKPHIIGFSTYTANIDRVNYLSGVIKKTFPSLKIVLGGIHASYLSDVCLMNPAVDFVICGEGELTFLDLVNAIRENTSFSKVDGLVYRVNERIVHTASRKLIENLDSLPWPAYHLIDFDNYYLGVTRAVTAQRVASVLTMRGCPYMCTFCSHSYGYNGRIRKRGPKEVVRELQYLYEECGIREVQFEDSSFTCDSERAIEICSLILKNKIQLVWNCNVRADTSSDRLFSAMREAGCRRILLGVESGSQRMLNAMKKGITVEQIRKTVRLAKKYHMRINCAFVIGIPGETPESLLQTSRFAKELDSDYVMFSVLVPSVGSEIFENALREKKIDVVNVQGADYISVYSRRLPIVEMSQISRRELFKLMEKYTTAFYLRPRYIIRRILGIKSWRGLIRIFYGAVLIFRHQIQLLNTMLMRTRK